MCKLRNAVRLQILAPPPAIFNRICTNLKTHSEKPTFPGATALSVQASQDQQNNRNCIFTLFTLNCTFILSGASQSFWKMMRAQNVESSLLMYGEKHVIHEL